MSATTVMHVIRDNGGVLSVSRTLCGRHGKRTAYDPYLYEGEASEFFACLPSDMAIGPTCGKCKGVAAILRGKGKR